MVEGSEFELPVPVSKLSDDSILLEFSTARRIALIAREPTIRYRQFEFTSSSAKESVRTDTQVAVASFRGLDENRVIGKIHARTPDHADKKATE